MRNKESFICLLFSVFFIVVLFLSGCKDDDANRPLSEIVYQTVWEVTELEYNLDDEASNEETYIVQFLTDSTGILVSDYGDEYFNYSIDGRLVNFDSIIYLILEQTDDRFVLQRYYNNGDKMKRVLTFNKMY